MENIADVSMECRVISVDLGLKLCNYRVECGGNLIEKEKRE